MKHRAPRTLAGDLKMARDAIRDASRAFLERRLAHAKEDAALVAWASVLALFAIALAGAWFGLAP